MLLNWFIAPGGGRDLDNPGSTKVCLALHQEMELLGCYLLSNLSLNYPHAVQSIGTIHDFQTLQVYNKKYNTMKTFVIATMLELENNCHIEQNLYDHFKLYIWKLTNCLLVLFEVFCLHLSLKFLWKSFFLRFIRALEKGITFLRG